MTPPRGPVGSRHMACLLITLLREKPRSVDDLQVYTESANERAIREWLVAFAAAGLVEKDGTRLHWKGVGKRATLWRWVEVTAARES